MVMFGNYVLEARQEGKSCKWTSRIPHNFNKLIKVLNDLFGSKIEDVEYFDNENEIIELHAQCFGWELFVSLVNNKGSVFDSRGKDISRTINDFDVKISEKIEELGVWNWYRKYPHKTKVQSLPDQVLGIKNNKS